MDRRAEMRRTMTLSEHLQPAPAIRDFLGVPHDDDDRSPSSTLINWKPLRDHLRLRRGAGAWRTTISPSPKPAAASTFARDTSTSSMRGGGEEDTDNEDEGRDDEEPASRMSLMTLLEQADNQWDDDDDGAPPTNSPEAAMAHVCCVCMVRQKGAAFIPCGHTFCRHCSRELWINRRNCPLCNAFVQEILHIF